MLDHRREDPTAPETPHRSTVVREQGALRAGVPPVATRPLKRTISALDRLESEGIHILREVAAETDKAVVLFSGGKDSICVLRLVEKAFRPAKIPFALLHVDTGHNFPEVLTFRDRRAQELGARLIVAEVEEAMQNGVVPSLPPSASRNQLQIPVLLNALGAHGFRAAIGGARRDEEKARAKERIFSFRDAFGQWDPRQQRPEPWDLYNAELNDGEQLRVFPLSNWTELDVWSYIQREKLEVPSIYFAHERPVVQRDGQFLAVSDLLVPRPGEQVLTKRVRVRTVGDLQCTGMIESPAANVGAIITEVAAATVTERGARADDKVSETAMEDRKRKGYF